MIPPIAFPDVEALIRQYLIATLPSHGYADIGVSVDVPRDRTNDTTFVTARRAGGPTRNIVVDAATLSVSSWAPTTVEASDLAQIVRALINSLAGQMLDGHQVYRVDEFTGPANLPDPDSRQPRYMQAFSVCIRGSEL